MTLRGPAEADAFRTTIYGQRWYHDPLPGCDLAAATDEKWPAVTTVKKAWSREFTKRWTDENVYPLDPLRVALYVDENIDMLAKLSTKERVPLMAGAAKRALRSAGNRGTQVHTIVEALSQGQQMWAEMVPAAAEYMAICERIVSELTPAIEYAEVVAIGRTLGVGGTVDAIARIGGKRYIVDWKSRGEDSNHGAYDNEAAQLGAYSLADYLIAEVDGRAARVAMPDLDGLLVVSIKPDSYECYPIDLEHAGAAAEALVDTWRHKKDGQSFARRAIGNPVVFDVVREAVRDVVRHEFEKCDACDQPRWMHDPKIEGGIDDHDFAVFEPEPTPGVSHDFRTPEPEAWTPPDEGPLIDDALAKIKKAYDARGMDRVATIAMVDWVREGNDSGRSWRITELASTRRYMIYRAVVRLLEVARSGDEIDGDIVRGLLSIALGEEVQPAMRIGMALGAMTTPEAKRLIEVCDALIAGTKAMTFDDAGRVLVVAA